MTTTTILAPIDNVLARAAAKGWSGKALAREAGLSESTIPEANGKKGLARHMALKPETLEKLAVPLGCSVEDLLRQADGAAGAAAATPALTMQGDGQPAVALRQLIPSLLNPRKTFDQAAIEELAASIAEQGLLQNLVVRPIQTEGFSISQGGKPADTFELISGERRFRALEFLARSGRWDAEAANIPVKVITADDALHIELALIENLQRQDVNPIEEAEALQQLQALDPKKWTGREIARKLGCSEGFVRQRLQLVGMGADGKAAMRDNTITFSQARVIAQAPTPEIEKKLLQKAVKESADPDDLRRELTRGLLDASFALFDLKASGLRTVSLEDGKVYVIDTLRFKQLQIEALRKLLPKLRKDWSWVEESAYFETADYEEQRSDNRKTAGALIELGYQFSLEDLDDLDDDALKHWDGEIKIHTGLIHREEEEAPAPRNETAAQKARREEEERKAREQKKMKAATNAFCRDLHAEILRRPDLALRLIMLYMLAGDDTNFQIYSPASASFAAGGPLEKMRPLVKNGSAGTAYLADNVSPADIWRGLMGRSEAQLIKALGHAAAEGLNVQYHTPPGEYLLLVAAELGVEVPEILRPQGQQELEQAPRKKGGK